jgi:hypothetical protein
MAGRPGEREVDSNVQKILYYSSRDVDYQSYAYVLFMILHALRY